jgi:hypothetical protein
LGRASCTLPIAITRPKPRASMPGRKACNNLTVAWRLTCVWAAIAASETASQVSSISTYADEKLKAAMPYAADEAAALKASRIHLPAFDEQARAHDIFIEETQAAVLGRKPPQRAMDDATARVKPLLG